MSNQPVTSVGGKDLQDFQALPRAPELSYLQKQGLPRKPRADPSTPKTLYQKLATFAAADWLKWVKEYALYRIGPRRRFPSYDDPATDDGIYPLAADDDGPVRVAIAGDWGTGTDEAFHVGERMKARDPHYTIHLGDIYFVGDPAETKENFLGVANPNHRYTPCEWPRGSKGAFALNGNHEMYARGVGYFDLVLKAMGMRAGAKGRPQKASFFALENEHWRVIALDTGYNSVGLPFVENILKPDCALPDPLIAWLRDVLKQQDDRRGIVLLSHHQYFSAFDDFYVKPAEQLAEFINRPVLWLWGHEHRLTIYGKQHAGSGIEAYGRCLGHGGMPVDLPPAAVRPGGAPFEFVDRRPYKTHEDLNVGVNGFATLTFEGAGLCIDYVDVDDTLLFRETWTTDPGGGLVRSKVWKLGDPVAAAPEPVS